MLKNFRLELIIRLLLLTATIAASIYLWIETHYYISAGLLGLLIVYQVARLIHFVDQTNRRLKRFLDSIRYSDFSRTFSSKKFGESFVELNEAFEDVVDEFKQQRLEKQIQFRYMETVVQHIGIGLISFNQKGEVELFNTAAKRLLQTSVLRNINDLTDISQVLYDTAKQLEGGEREVVRISVNSKSRQLAVYTTVFRLRDQMYKLVSLQDIHAELEEKEMEAWQNLTEVLAHEIMNSVTPIASLSDTIQMLLKKHAHENGEEYVVDKEAIYDVGEALDTIENRSRGLIRFVNSYRDITKVPKPDREQILVKELLQRAKKLNKGEAEKLNIAIDISVEPETLEVTADPHLIDQVLINLIKNAFRALKKQEQGRIFLEGKKTGPDVHIDVRDNGPGIKPESIEKIFIPFYSTRRPTQEEGTGIGLSLSRQIMRAHRGNISVDSEMGKGTIFTLRF